MSAGTPRYPLGAVVAVVAAAAIMALLPAPSAAQGLAEHAFIRWNTSLPDIARLATALPPERRNAHTAEGAGVVETTYELGVHFGATTVEVNRTSVHEFLSHAGIEQLGNSSLYVDSYSESIEIEHAAVLTADGRVIDVDPSTVQVLLEDTGGVFSDEYRIVIPWPNLEPGARTVLAYRITSELGRLAAPWSTMVHPMQLHPREHIGLAIGWDQHVEAPVMRSDYPALDCEESSTREIRCTAREVPAARTDIAVRYADVLPHVLIAEAATWEGLVSLLGGHVESALNDDTTIAAAVSPLIEGLDTPRERLAALHSFVSREIRYVGLEAGVGGIVPRDSALTLERRYGDCKDKTALFIHMARLAGIDAQPILISTQRRRRDNLLAPSVAYFDHMIACATTGDEVFCVDLTDPYTPMGIAPPRLAGAASLALAEGAKQPQPLQPLAVQWRLFVETDVSFDGHRVVEDERRHYERGYDGNLRGFLQSVSEADRRDWVTRNYRETLGVEVDPEFSIVGMHEQQAPLIIETHAGFDNVIPPGTPLNYVHYPAWLIDFVRSLRNENRHYAYQLEGGEYRERTRFTLGERGIESLGAEIDFDSRFGRLRRTYLVEGGDMIVETRLWVPTQSVTLDELPAFNRFLATLIDNSGIRVRTVR